MEEYKEMENKIIDNLKLEISISKFRKENSKYLFKNPVNRIKRIIITIISLLTATSGTIIFAYSLKEFKNINNLDTAYALIQNINTDSIKDATDSGYIENIDMNYVYSNNIGCKLNNFTFSDNDLSIVFDFDFDKNNITQNKLLANIIIYNENKNVFCNYTPSIDLKNNKYQKALYKNKGLDESSEISSLTSYSNLYETPNQVISQLLLSEPNEYYPDSNKLYIYIYGIGYLDSGKYVYLDKEANWSFEINIPEKFKNNQNITYKLEETIEGFSLNNLYITDTHTTVKYISDYWDTNIELIDEYGNTYKHYSKKKLDNDNQYLCSFNLNKNMLNNKLYLRIIKGSNIEEIELKKE